MKTILNLFVFGALLAVAPGRCLALRSIGVLSATEAKAKGVEFRATPAGPDAESVELEFKTEGVFKEYSAERGSCVELEIRDETKSLLSHAALLEQHPAPGHVRVRFLVNRAYLDKVILTIVVGQGAMAGGAYELHVKEFLGVATGR